MLIGRVVRAKIKAGQANLAGYQVQLKVKVPFQAFHTSKHTVAKCGLVKYEHIKAAKSSDILTTLFKNHTSDKTRCKMNTQIHSQLKNSNTPLHKKGIFTKYENLIKSILVVYKAGYYCATQEPNLFSRCKGPLQSS